MEKLPTRTNDWPDDPLNSGARVQTRWLVGATLLVGLVGNLGCTFLTDNTIAQCETTAECAARGGEFSGTICGEDNFCRVPTSSETGCTTNHACSVEIGGLPAICPTLGGACQPLLSDDCTLVFGDFENDNAIPVGVVVPLTGPFQASGFVHANAVELAFEELAVRQIGLPGVGAERRPVVGILCDEANAARAATFLTEDVHVPAVIGPIASDNVLEVATSVTIAGGVLLVAPQAGAPSLRQLEDDGLVWHTIGGIDAVVRAQAAHLQDYVEPAVRTRLGLSMNDQIRLMVIAQSETTPASSADAAVATLVFNGQSALDNGSNFLRRDYAGVDTAAAVADAIAFEPHIIVPYGFNEVYEDLLPQIERGLPVKPHYLMTSVAYGHPLLTEFISSDPNDRAMRVTGATDLEISGPVAGTFAVAYRGKFGEDPTSSSAFTYDAAYAVMYGLAAAGHVPELTGNAAAVGMTKLVDGVPINIGAAGIDQALGILPNGGTIDVEGASGPLNFDTATGDVVPIVRIWCVNAQSEHMVTEQSYDDGTGTLSGVFSCP